MYPLVNVYITMGNHHAMKMGIHQLNFDWAIFNREMYVKLPEGMA
jgi:hypothetical protein